MKKIAYLLSLVAVIMISAASCEKDEPVVPNTGLITATELIGQWNFVSYEYNGKVYTTCDQIANDAYLKGKYSLILSFNVNAPISGFQHTYLTEECMGSVAAYLTSGELGNNELILGKNIYVFNVISYNKTTKKLTLKLISINRLGGTTPINGIYTLQK